MKMKKRKKKQKGFSIRSDVEELKGWLIRPSKKKERKVTFIFLGESVEKREGYIYIQKGGGMGMGNISQFETKVDFSPFDDKSRIINYIIERLLFLLFSLLVVQKKDDANLLKTFNPVLYESPISVNELLQTSTTNFRSDNR